MKEGTGNRQSFDCAVYRVFCFYVFVKCSVPPDYDDQVCQRKSVKY